MKSESEPIADDEWLLRRVWWERFRSQTTPIISPNAFEPRTGGREPDVDGISFYRAACVSDSNEVLATVAADKRPKYAIVKIPVALVRTLGLSLVAKQDSRIQGHVVIPEINAIDYARDKARFTAIKNAFAIEASRTENIVKRPTE